MTQGRSGIDKLAVGVDHVVEAGVVGRVPAPDNLPLVDDLAIGDRPLIYAGNNYCRERAVVVDLDARVIVAGPADDIDLAGKRRVIRPYRALMETSGIDPPT